MFIWLGDRCRRRIKTTISYHHFETNNIYRPSEAYTLMDLSNGIELAALGTIVVTHQYLCRVPIYLLQMMHSEPRAAVECAPAGQFVAWQCGSEQPPFWGFTIVDQVLLLGVNSASFQA